METEWKHEPRRTPVNRGEYLQLLGEKTAVERMIAETPEEDAIDRASLSARLKNIEEALAQAELRDARRERDEALSRVAAEAGKDLAAWARDLDAAEAAHARVVAERDGWRMRAEDLTSQRDSLERDAREARERCRDAAQVLAHVTAERDEARRERDEARADVERLRSAYKRYGAAGVSEALKAISQRDGHPSDSTR